MIGALRALSTWKPRGRPKPSTQTSSGEKREAQSASRFSHVEMNFSATPLLQ